MTMRKTPYERIRYPWTSDVAAAADLDAMASDIDQALVRTASLANNFSRFASATAKRNAAQSITKNVLTAVTFDSVPLDNGSDSPLANGSWWNAANPTRLTAPVPCIVLATAAAGMVFSTALGTTGAFQVTVTLNGAAGQPGTQGSKYYPVSTATGQQWLTALTMWKLAAGDYLELKLFWFGTPAGPFNTDTVLPPTLSVAMVALPSVP